MHVSPVESSAPAAGPLAGLKVLELGQLIAGPFAAKTLADFGADVVKIESPGAGDPLRKWRLLKDGTEVTALAREGTYMILIKGDGFAGWADIDLLTSEKPADS